jgi:VanZ family protein
MVMKTSSKRGWWPAKKYRWSIWLVYMAVWSVALLVPMPTGPGWTVRNIDVKLVAGKALHVCAYAVLAGLTGWLEVPCRFRWLLIYVLAAHATATEFIQQFIEGRTGRVHDVGLDLIGVALGCLVTWPWWSEPPPERGPLAGASG